MDRITLLIDMDCFYVQVEQKVHPETVGLPCAVIQYTSLAAASLVAVSYEAREKGVTRSMNGDAAKNQCPDLLLFQVPMRRGKADLTKYRDASAEVIKSISKFTSKIERASIDEAYIDATDLLSSDTSESTISLERSNVVVDPDSMKHLYDPGDLPNPPYSCSINEISGQMDAIECLCDGRKLRQALCLAQKIKDQILADTGFRCSIGVSSNRMLSKIACSLNKPDKITIVPLESVQHLMNFTRVKKVPGLGGKLGKDLALRFNLEFIGSLTAVPLPRLIEEYGEKTGAWLYELCRGRDYQAVSTRTLVKSIACSKNFLGKSALKKDAEILHWLTNLAGEIVERVAIDRANHNRLPTALSLFLRSDQSDTRSRALNPNILASILPRSQQMEEEETEAQIARRIAEMAYGSVRSLIGTAAITNISLSVGKFKSDHSAACGDVKKLLTEPPKLVERESFFRQFFETGNQAEPSTPKKVAFEGSLHQATEPKAQEETKASKELVYFQRHNSTTEKVLCEECGSYVLVHLMPEHRDFHFARRVQQEWNREVNRTLQPLQVKKETRTIRETKRGRGRGKRDLGLAKIDTFFLKRD
uniref:DNA polymerase eta n=1 Tax=Echinococcus canadensis TaxID=519352 RepID=A0A915EUS5_9CEST